MGHLVQFSTYANLDRVCGQNHRRYWNIVDCFLKWNPKRSISTNFEMKIYLLLLPKNVKLTFEHDN